MFKGFSQMLPYKRRYYQCPVYAAPISKKAPAGFFAATVPGDEVLQVANLLAKWYQ